MKIIMKELEDLCNAMLTRLESAGLSTAYLPEDFYWNIFFDNACNQLKKPKPGMGSLFDDWNALKQFNAGAQLMTFIEFYSIGNLITAIGNEFEKLPNKTPRNDWPLELSDLRKICNFIFTHTKKHNQDLPEELSISSTHYWCVDLDCIYLDEPPKNSQINLQIIPNDLPALTSKIQHHAKLTIKDFELVGVLLKLVGSTPERVFYAIDDNE